MKVATWNVNGIRAREAQVREWLARDRPDVVCLQEIKAKPEQVPELLFESAGYWCYWHGAGGYSGRRAAPVAGSSAPSARSSRIPSSTTRRASSRRRSAAGSIASVYVPNGGKDYAAKLRFLEALGSCARASSATAGGSSSSAAT